MPQPQPKKITLVACGCVYDTLYAHLLPIVADYEVCVMQICKVQILLYKLGHVLNIPAALNYQPFL